MNKSLPTFPLKNGMKIPAVGLGTHLLQEPQKMVELAIDNGYRLIDGAWMYRTEPDVGKAVRNKIKAGVIKREDIFIISKLWRTMHDPKDVSMAMEKTLKDLGLKYVDSYLMHFPLASKESFSIFQTFFLNWRKINSSLEQACAYFPQKAADEYELLNLEEADIPIEVTWKAMENLVKLGYAKSVGLSNFNSTQINRIIGVSEFFPVINEIEVNPFFYQKPLIDHCKQNGIQVLAYGAFYSPENPWLDPDIPSLIAHSTVKKLAQKHKKTPGQIIIRYLHQIDCVPITKTNFVDHLVENINIFDDWNGLDDQDMNEMTLLNTGKRRFRFDKSKHFKEYPFTDDPT